ncbi:MAG: DNA repair protein RecO [Lachnospiraceae bacterium]|nr:DNA repair protein RecO [Lachnospiraceae bacterium]
MQDFVTVTGMVIKTIPVGEYDRSVVLLTKERGKISAFAKGARKQTSRFSAAANPFSFGTFKLFVGRTSYNIMEADISNYFESLRTDFEGAYYGIYFLEIADYYTRENNDEKEMLKLLYQSMRALQNERLLNELVRYIFEIKAMAVNGEFPGVPADMQADESTRYAVSYIVSSTIEKLYTFTVSRQVLGELGTIAQRARKRVMDRDFKSLEVLDKLCVEKLG